MTLERAQELYEECREQLVAARELHLPRWELALAARLQKLESVVERKHKERAKAQQMTSDMFPRFLRGHGEQ